jgi:hypothetical protein
LASATTRPSDANPVASLQQTGVSFRNPQAQLEILLRDHDDGIALQHDGPDHDQPLEHAPILGRQNLAFTELLIDDSALGSPCTQAVLGDVERCARFVELDARNRAALDKPLGAGEIDLRLVGLRLEGLNLRIERLQLKNELLVPDDRDRLAALHRVALADVELDHRTADAAARRHDADALDGRKDRLLVGDRSLDNRQRFRRGQRGRQHQRRRNNR